MPCKPDSHYLPDAASLLSKGTLELSGRVMTVTQPPAAFPGAAMVETDLDLDTLELFFTDPDQCGAHTFSHMVQESEGRVIVYFTEPSGNITLHFLLSSLNHRFKSL